MALFQFHSWAANHKKNTTLLDFGELFFFLKPFDFFWSEIPRNVFSCYINRELQTLISSQCAAGHGRAGVRRDVPGEASAASVRGVRVRLPPEHAQQRAGIDRHQRDPAPPPSKGQSESETKTDKPLLLYDATFGVCFRATLKFVTFCSHKYSQISF